MLRVLATAAKAAGLTYSLLSTGVMVVLLVHGTYTYLKNNRQKPL